MSKKLLKENLNIILTLDRDADIEGASLSHKLVSH